MLGDPPTPSPLQPRLAHCGGWLFPTTSKQTRVRHPLAVDQADHAMSGSFDSVASVEPLCYRLEKYSGNDIALRVRNCVWIAIFAMPKPIFVPVFLLSSGALQQQQPQAQPVEHSKQPTCKFRYDHDYLVAAVFRFHKI